MPYLPPNRHRPPGADAQDRARARQEQNRHARRPTAAERGYDDDWARVRDAFIATHPTCEVDGCGKPATDADHVVAIADAPARRLDFTNLRALCHAHHSARTARDQSFTPGTPRGARHPEWLRPALNPMTLVAGPPGSGKSTWVRQRAGTNDMILDMAEITAKVSGFPLYGAPSSWRDAALRWRNSRLALLSVTHRWPQSWVILGEPRARWRRWWRSHMGARVVVIETPTATCLERIGADDAHGVVAHGTWAAAIRSWWERYERDDLDMVLSPDGRMTTGATARRRATHGGWVG